MAEASILAEPGLSFPEAIPIPNLPNSSASLYQCKSLHDSKLMQRVRETWPKKPIAASFSCWNRQLRCQFVRLPKPRLPLGRLCLSPASCAAMNQNTRAEKNAPLKKTGPVTPAVSFDGGNCPIQTQREVLFWSGLWELRWKVVP